MMMPNDKSCVLIMIFVVMLIAFDGGRSLFAQVPAADDRAAEAGNESPDQAPLPAPADDDKIDWGEFGRGVGERLGNALEKTGKVIEENVSENTRNYARHALDSFLKDARIRPWEAMDLSSSEVSDVHEGLKRYLSGEITAQGFAESLMTDPGKLPAKTELLAYIYAELDKEFVEDPTLPLFLRVDETGTLSESETSLEMPGEPVALTTVDPSDIDKSRVIKSWYDPRTGFGYVQYRDGTTFIRMPGKSEMPQYVQLPEGVMIKSHTELLDDYYLALDLALNKARRQHNSAVESDRGKTGWWIRGGALLVGGIWGLRSARKTLFSRSKPGRVTKVGRAVFYGAGCTLVSDPLADKFYYNFALPTMDEISVFEAALSEGDMEMVKSALEESKK